jgi:hypothetical protein
LDLTFAFERTAGGVANVKSAALVALERTLEMGYQQRGNVSQNRSRQLAIE